MKQFLQTLENAPDSISFNDTMGVIDANYNFIPAAFRNGEMQNEAGQNNGSCKVFSFARLHHLTQQQTLHCFGSYYRDDVLKHPQGSDHQNIRNFMKTGWGGIVFEGNALALKKIQA
ncbi:MAG: HopJ type III effector protein [Gallionella sp.]|nr:HopJ type III effector protein [Gallionella sp.]